MITDEQKSLLELYNDEQKLLLLLYYDRGVLKKEIRSYEVSLWTLQDSFITVLKWSDVEQKGRIENPKMTLNIDGTLKFTFSIPMYYEWNGKLIENPNWSTIKEDNIIKGLRKVKVIFNKSTSEEGVFEFVITNVSENHEGDILTCEVESEGLAFQELGKIGYKVNLSMDNFELIYANWLETGSWTKPDGTISTAEPMQTVGYWCEEAGLVKLPLDTSNILSRTWYYDIRMSWRSFAGGSSRVVDEVYEEPYTSSWDTNLNPLTTESYTIKLRAISVENSNLYNITQTIAELFLIYCRYEYLYDDNYNIIGRVVVFYNNFFEEDKPILSILYPYSATRTERTIDSTNVVTKLYVLSADNNVTLEGDNTIMNAPPNASREDYILNFDYMRKIGSIDDDQYNEIKNYEILMKSYNDLLIELQLKLVTLLKLEVDFAAKKTIAVNSVDLDNELILQNNSLFNALDNLDELDGYVSITAENADYLLILTSDTGEKYLNLTNTNKGIKEDSIAIYKTLTTTNNGPVLSNLITHFFITKDEFNNATKITLTNSSEVGASTTKVYLTYLYQPKLYYENVVNTWKIKLAQDNDTKKEYTIKLGPKSATELGYDLSVYPTGITVAQAYNQGIYKKINDYTDEIERLLREKKQAIAAFERLMGPALREGYWQPEDYSDYGDHKRYTSSITQNDITVDTGTDAIVAWDSTLFDEEDKLYYKVGITETKEYYPCIDLNAVFSNNIPTNLSNYSVVWKASSNGSYSWNDVLYLGVMAVGSKALIRFLKVGNDIKPVLMLVGAKTFSPSELERLIVSGEARLEIYSTVINNNGTITVSHNSTRSIGNNWLCFTSRSSMPSNWTSALWDKYAYISSETQRPLVLPRIKISSLALKTDTTNLAIKYNNQLLTFAADYYINTRDTERNSVYYLEYYITIKPEVLIRCGLNGTVYINYVISNANTAIYLDALKVSKENAEPKVSYNVSINLLNLNLSHTLYLKLALIMMINDAQLKLEDAFCYISELELDLDAPQNDTITVQNYTTKFEDIFSTIVASVEEMKRMGNRLSTTVAGGTGLSLGGLQDTLSLHELVLLAYIDSWFDSSQVVRDTLWKLFTEASEILADSNKTLNRMRALTLTNVDILSGFARNVAEELSGQVYKSLTKPINFKPNDVWIEVDADNNVIGRYIATAFSKDSGSNGTSGFVRTYDGTLASITGASVDFNADTGIVDITALNLINIKSGNNIYIAANENVDIVGNKLVNIGGTEINLCTLAERRLDPITNLWEYVYNGNLISEKTTTGINLIAGTYRSDGNYPSTVSRVLLKPASVEIGAAKLELLAASSMDFITSRGNASDTSALHISSDDGIWMGTGTNGGIRLFSGNISKNSSTGALETSVNGATVELNNDHLIFGFMNVKATSGTIGNAIEMTQDYMIFASGTPLTGTSSDADLEVTGEVSSRNPNSLVGAKFTQSSIGFATLDDDTINAIIMNDDGITIASDDGGINLIDPLSDLKAYFNEANKAHGSYVRVAASGIEFGSMADLYINTTNFKLLTHSREKGNQNSDFKDGETIMALGNNLLGIDYTTKIVDGVLKDANNNTLSNVSVRLLVNKDGLYANGAVYATSFTATGPNGYLKATTTNFGFYDSNNQAILTINSNAEIVASKKLSISAENLYIGNQSYSTISTSINNNNTVESLKMYRLWNSNDDSTNIITGSGTTTADSNWTEAVPAPTDSAPYIWSVMRYKKGNNNYYYSTPQYEATLSNLEETTYYKFKRTSTTSTPTISSLSDLNTNWFLEVPADTASETASGEAAFSNPYIWRTTVTVKVGGRITWSTPERAEDYEGFSNAGLTAINIANGYTAVPHVETTGISIGNGSMSITALATLSIIGNHSITIGSEISNSAIVIDNNGISIGTGKSLGLAAGGTLDISTTNLILKSNATGTNSIFELKKLLSGSTTNYDTALKYSTTNGLEVHGSGSFTGEITATSLTIAPPGDTPKTITQYIDGRIPLVDTNAYATWRVFNADEASDKSLAILSYINGRIWNDLENTGSDLSITKEYIRLYKEVSSVPVTEIFLENELSFETFISASKWSNNLSSCSYTDSAHAHWHWYDRDGKRYYGDGGHANALAYITSNWLYNNHKWYYFNADGSMAANLAVWVNSDSRYYKLDRNGICTESSITLNQDGIEMYGKRLRMNGEDAWGRDDIVIMNPNDASSWRHNVTSIESHMSGKHDWVLIRPYYDAKVEYMRFSNGGSVTCNGSYHDFYSVRKINPNEALGGNASWYKYEVKFLPFCGRAMTIQNIKIKITGTNYEFDSAIDFNGVHGVAHKLVEYSSNTFAANRNLTFTITFWSTTNFCAENLESINMLIAITVSGTADYVKLQDETAGFYSFIATCDATTSRVPCTVYYYP